MVPKAENAAVEIDNTILLRESPHLLYALSYISITRFYVFSYEHNYHIMYSVWFNKTELGYEREAYKSDKETLFIALDTRNVVYLKMLWRNN